MAAAAIPRPASPAAGPARPGAARPGAVRRGRALQAARRPGHVREERRRHVEGARGGFGGRHVVWPRAGPGMAGAGSNWLSGVNVVLVMAYGSLVFVLLFIFVKRQIMRFAMKSRRGPHVPVGQHAPKDLKEEIDIRLSRVQDIKYEPRLLAEDDSRLLQLETQGCYNYLLELRNSSASFKGIRKALIDTLLDGYESARYGTGVFGKPEYLKYQDALNELANMTKARGGSSQRQHQSAAKDLTLSPEVSNPATIQVTYLPSSQKSKRAKHFLELKSFKDNYNTLESTL